MRLIFAGTPQVAAESLKMLLDWAATQDSIEIVGVLTRPDAPTGRGKKMVASPVAAVAAESGLNTLKAADAKNPQVVQWVQQLAPDCAVVVAYGGLIPPELLQVPTHGWINVHYSLLPRWRGAAPVQHAILAGDQTSGVTIFQLVAALDAGSYYRQKEVPLGSGNAGEILSQLTPLGVDELVATLQELVTGQAVLTPQPDVGISYAGKLDATVAQIDWCQPAAVIARQVRACNPAPMAWTSINGGRFRILAVLEVEDCELDLAPGQFHLAKDQVRVGTGSGSLKLLQVQAAGKKPMAALDWARGIREAPVAQ